jgi:hypothetical protein
MCAGSRQVSAASLSPGRTRNSSSSRSCRTQSAKPSRIVANKRVQTSRSHTVQCRYGPVGKHPAHEALADAGRAAVQQRLAARTVRAKQAALDVHVDAGEGAGASLHCAESGAQWRRPATDRAGPGGARARRHRNLARAARAHERQNRWQRMTRGSGRCSENSAGRRTRVRARCGENVRDVWLAARARATRTVLSP